MAKLSRPQGARENAVAVASDAEVFLRALARIWVVLEQLSQLLSPLIDRLQSSTLPRPRWPISVKIARTRWVLRRLRRLLGKYGEWLFEPSELALWFRKLDSLALGLSLVKGLSGDAREKELSNLVARVKSLQQEIVERVQANTHE